MKDLILVISILSITKLVIGFFAYSIIAKVPKKRALASIFAGTAASSFFLYFIIIYSLMGTSTENFRGMGSERGRDTLGLTIYFFLLSPLFLLVFSALDGYFVSNFNRETNLSTVKSFTLGLMVNVFSFLLVFAGYIIFQ